MSGGDSIYKIVILGDGRVGKTSILSRYFTDKFNESEQSTVNPSCYNKTVTHKGMTIKFVFWDTAGQEKFNAINAIYYQGAVGAILVYDASGFDTFARVEVWSENLKEMVSPDIPFVIVGNKIDLIGKDDMDKQTPKIDEFIRSHKCQNIYTSAKSGYNVKQAVDKIIQLVLEKEKPELKKQGSDRRKLVVTEDHKETKKKSCC